jgi:EpsI family protein
LPLWSIFSEPLQTPTAIFVDFLLKLTGYTSFQQDYFIHIPEGIFEVGDTCSGLRYQIAAITTTTLYVFYYRYKLRSSILCILGASIVAFLSNTIRIYIVVLSGHYTNMTHSLLEDHIWLGWIIFGIFFLSYLFIIAKVEKYIDTLAPITDTSENLSNLDKRQTSLLRLSAFPVVIALLSSIGPFLNDYFSNTQKITDLKSIRLNTHVNGWTHVDTTDQIRPNWQTSDYEINQRYSSNNDTVDLFLSTFYMQSQGKELVSDLNFPYNTDHWKLVKQNETNIDLNSSEIYTLTETIIENQTRQKRIIWSLYYISGKTTHDKLHAKLYGVLQTLSGRNDQTVYIISTSIEKDIEKSRNTLKKFFSHSFFDFKSQLDTLNVKL